MAIVVAASLVSISFVAGIATLIGLAVLVAHLANPKVKRLVSATLIAVVLASLLAVVRADDFVMLDPCKTHEPWSFLWIAAGCFWP